MFPCAPRSYAAAIGPEPVAPGGGLGRSGTDHVGLEAAARCGVTVTHTPGLTRDLPGHNEDAHHGGWRTPVAQAVELSELTPGIVGLGRIGGAPAERAAALGMEVRALSTRPAARRETVPASRRIAGQVTGQVTRVGSLAELLATCDVISLHLPLTERTRGMTGRAEPARMRPGSILLNTARGGIVDEQAPADALRDPAHPLSAAAVDTFEHEHAAFASPAPACRTPCSPRTWPG